MNEHTQQARTTQAADGLPRRKWTASDIQKMLDAGILQSGERFELIGGSSSRWPHADGSTSC